MPLFQIEAVIALVGVGRAVVELDDIGAYAIQKVAVVRDHQQAHPRAGEVILEPSGRLEVEVVRRFVQNQQLRLANQRACKRHALDLSARQLLGRLGVVGDTQPGENLLDLRFVVPCLPDVHFGHGPVQTLLVARAERQFVGRDRAQGRRVAREAGVEHGLARRKLRVLLQIGDFQVASPRNAPCLVVFFSGEDVQQRRLARSVFRDQPDALALADGERKVLEKHPFSERLGEPLGLQITCHSPVVCPYKVNDPHPNGQAAE